MTENATPVTTAAATHTADAAADAAAGAAHPFGGAAAFEARGLRTGYGDRPVLDALDLVLPAGEVTSIVGANACGKSTLLRSLAGLLPSGGEIHVAGRPLAAYARRELARTVAFLPQSPIPPEGVSVDELVLRGRFPHRGLGLRPSAEDREQVQWAMHATDTAQLAGRPLATLSGGQRQRAWIAMALAQDTPIVLLDEPTTYLDLAHQLDLLTLLRRLNRESGRTIVMVLHDLNQAARFSDRIVGVKDGVVHASGTPGEVVDAAFVQAVLGVNAIVVPDPVTGTPMAVPR
ncbi:MAG: ABC transporter ATP-binding protein [Patulibacter minatonensis]